MAELDGIAAGTVDLVFRRWSASRVKAGSRRRTHIGVVAIDAVALVERDALTDADARRTGAASVEALQATLDRFGDAPIHRIQLHLDGPDPRVALREALPSDDELVAVQQRLDRLDVASRRGPWTGDVLRCIAERPGVRAPDLAASFGLETLVFKRDVRKLKDLGLTESLTVGYRLSPRGAAVLARLAG
jgi:hypothetical protein